MRAVARAGRRLFTVEEYHRMAEAGILSEDDRVELLEGEVVELAPMGSRHAACVDRLNGLLNKLPGLDAIVRVQSPIRIDDRTEPDIALLKPREDFYSGGHPAPADVLLVIEVSDTSLEYDPQIKLPLYARAGIPEAWIVALESETIEAHSRPASAKTRTPTSLPAPAPPYSAPPSNAIRAASTVL